MRFFVYGKLKTGEPKGWWLGKLIATSVDYKLKGYKMYVVRFNKVAGLVKDSETDFVFGEIKEIKKWVPWIIRRLLLCILDINEGIPFVYRREEIPLPGAKLAWVYLYNGDVTGAKEIHEWSAHSEVRQFYDYKRS